jgi:hypothetical protein
MDQEEKGLLIRVLDMNETELRATLLTIIRDIYEADHDRKARNVLKIAVDMGYNTIRRTGVRI